MKKLVILASLIVVMCFGFALTVDKIAPRHVEAQIGHPPVIQTTTIPTACGSFLYAYTVTSPWTIYAPTTTGACQALGGGSGTVSGQAAGVIPLGTSATVIGARSALSDNGVVVASTEPIAVGATAPVGSSIIATQQDLNLFTITAPATAPAAAVGGAGLLTGTYQYTVDYVSATGEGNVGISLSNTVSPASQTVLLTGVPVSSDPNVIARNIYRNNNGWTGNMGDPHVLEFVTQIADNTTTTYTDNTPDGSLTGVFAPWAPKGFGNINSAAYGGSIFTCCGAMLIGPSMGSNGYANTGMSASGIPNCTYCIRNTFMGIFSLYSITTGNQNVAIAPHALTSLTTGDENTCVGYISCFFDIDGSYNTGIGQAALNSGTHASYNTGVGIDALSALTTGGSNVGIGFQAGEQTAALAPLQTNTNSVFIGANSFGNANGDTNEVCIGYQCLGQGSNTVSLGNLSTTAAYVGATEIALVTGATFSGAVSATHGFTSNNAYMLGFSNFQQLTGGQSIAYFIPGDDLSTTMALFGVNHANSAYTWKIFDDGSASFPALSVDGSSVKPVLRATSGSIGGSALLVNNCATGTVTVTGATTGMVVNVSPVADPNGASTFDYAIYGIVSSANTVTVKVCAVVAGTPTATTYNVAVIQ